MTRGRAARGERATADDGTAAGAPAGSGELATVGLRSALGELAVTAGPDGLRRVWWRGDGPGEEDRAGDRAPGLAARAADRPGGGAESASRGEAVAAAAVEQLFQYMNGERRAFELPLAPGDLPPFRRRVLRELARIPYGATASYGELAARCGRPGAARAVGNAVARNPLPVVLPCHRVIRSDGSPGGYGGGRGRKRALLRLEGLSEA